MITPHNVFELRCELRPRLMVLRQLLLAASQHPLDVVPNHDEEDEQVEFFSGLAHQVESIMEVLDRAQDADPTTGDAK